MILVVGGEVMVVHPRLTFICMPSEKKKKRDLNDLDIHK